MNRIRDTSSRLKNDKKTPHSRYLFKWQSSKKIKLNAIKLNAQNNIFLNITSNKPSPPTLIPRISLPIRHPRDLPPRNASYFLFSTPPFYEDDLSHVALSLSLQFRSPIAPISSIDEPRHSYKSSLIGQSYRLWDRPYSAFLFRHDWSPKDDLPSFSFEWSPRRVTALQISASSLSHSLKIEEGESFLQIISQINDLLTTI